MKPTNAVEVHEIDLEQVGVAANTKLSEAEMKKLEKATDEINVKVLGPDMFRFAIRQRVSGT